MIFVDTNIFVYVVGKPHPLREDCRRFFVESRLDGVPMFTSAQVLQELLHVYLPVGRLSDLENALNLVRNNEIRVLPLEWEDIEMAQHIHVQYPNLSANDLCHLASCHRHGISEFKTFDRQLHQAFYDVA